MNKLITATAAGLMLGAAMLIAQAKSFAEVSEAGAAEVKRHVEEALAYPLELQRVHGTGLMMDGAVEVAPKGDYYEVRVPKLSYLADAGMRADLGTLVINVTPGASGEYRTSVAVAPTITVYEGTSTKVIAEATVGSQEFSGIWWPQYRTFTQVSARYGDLKLSSRGEAENFTVNVKEIRTGMELTRNSGDVWSGPARVELHGITAGSKDKGEIRLSVDSIAAQNSFDKMDLKLRREIEDKTRQIVRDASQNKQADPQQAKAAIAAMMASMQNYVDGMGSTFKISNVAVDLEPGAGETQPDGKPVKPRHVRIATINSAFSAGGMLQEKGGMSLQIGMEGLNVENLDEVAQAIVPNASNIELRLEGLPMQELSKAFAGLMPQMFESAVAAQTAMDPAQKEALEKQTQAKIMLTMAAIPQQLATAGATLKILNTFTKAPDIASTLEGSFVANAASPLVAQGSMTLQISGLDELILKLQTMAQQPNADPRLIGWSQGLGVMQLMGQLGKGPDGRSQRSYKLELTPEGRTLLNGQDMAAAAAMMGAQPQLRMTPPAPAPEPAPATP